MKQNSKKTVRNIIILVLILAFAIAAIFLYRYFQRTIFNDTLVYGNTAGNFYNGGLFCEANGYVYFVNPRDENRLYRMRPDGSEVEKLSDDSAHCINADSHYIYYARANSTAKQEDAFSFLNFNTNSLCRVNLKGKGLVILDNAPTLFATLIENTVYYIHYDTETASTLYKVGIDGEDKKMISQTPLRLSPGQQGTLCYAGEDEPGIFLWNPTGDKGTLVYPNAAYYPIDSGDSIYFLDGENDYHLSRYDKTGGAVTDLTGCRVDSYNLSRDYIYYQKNEDPALCRISLNGDPQEEVVMPGAFKNISVTSRYVYFKEFSGTETCYQTPADGPVNVGPFYPISDDVGDK